MSANFVEVCIRTDADSGELLARLRDRSALGSWEEDGILHIYWPEEKWTPAILDDLKRAFAAMGMNPGSSRPGLECGLGGFAAAYPSGKAYSNPTELASKRPKL
jgi:hypothetical protein